MRNRPIPCWDDTCQLSSECRFKQILFELDSCLEIFAAPVVQEECLLTVVARLRRITEIQRILLDQVRVLETMTPGDFLDFRDYLFPASGFQSVQFKLLENKLGLLRDKRTQCAAYSDHC